MFLLLRGKKLGGGGGAPPPGPSPCYGPGDASLLVTVGSTQGLDTIVGKIENGLERGFIPSKLNCLKIYLSPAPKSPPTTPTIKKK